MKTLNSFILEKLKLNKKSKFQDNDTVENIIFKGFMGDNENIDFPDKNPEVKGDVIAKFIRDVVKNNNVKINDLKGPFVCGEKIPLEWTDLEVERINEPEEQYDFSYEASNYDSSFFSGKHIIGYYFEPEECYVYYKF